ncbi:hypothetical protein [Gilvimarinus polysaccharolyticus]|uniref:hypothetical protein n=1 Tax=Gilvimarinus polysaccharolyticus TaxID=863921 RepID=UPI000673C19D|nr:hypothetical protein [Gilvimarinus polysaccharolyticus]
MLNNNETKNLIAPLDNWARHVAMKRLTAVAEIESLGDNASDADRFYAVESYECGTLVKNPALFDRVLESFEKGATRAIMRRLILQKFSVAERATNRHPLKLPADDDTGLRHLLLFVLPSTGELAFLGVTNAELKRHRDSSSSSIAAPGCGHFYMFRPTDLGPIIIENLLEYFACRDLRAWPVWGLHPSGNEWLTDGRSLASCR